MSSHAKNMEIERLRAIAVIMVVFTHFGIISPALPAPFRNGMTGVDLFFVISGFVVSLSLLKTIEAFAPSTQPLTGSRAFPIFKLFYGKRFFRILPSAFFWMFFYFMLSVIFQNVAPGLFGTPLHLLTEIGYFMTGLYNYLIQFIGFDVQYIGPYWSLTVEEHFYLILPLVLVFFRTYKSRFWAVLAGVLLVVLVLRPGIPVPEGWNKFSFKTFSSHRRFDSLFIGVLVGLFSTTMKFERLRLAVIEFHLRHRKSVQALALVLSFVLLFLVWSLVYYLPPSINLDIGLTIYALFAAALVFMAALNRNFVFNIPYVSKALEFVGSRSYAIYLCHIAAVTLWMHYSSLYSPFGPWFFESNAGRWLQLPFLWAIILVFAEFSHRCIEKPMMALGHRVLSGTRKSENSVPERESRLVPAK